MRNTKSTYMSVIIPSGMGVLFEDVYLDYDQYSKFHKVLNYNHLNYPSPREFNLKVSKFNKVNIGRYNVDLKSYSSRELVISSKEELVKWHIYNHLDELVLSFDDQNYSEGIIMLKNLESGSYYIEFLMDHGTIFTNYFALSSNFLGLN